MRVTYKLALPLVTLALAAAGAWWTTPPALAQSAGPTTTRVGWIDTNRVMARSAAGVSAREALEREKAAMQKQVDGIQAELAKLKDDLEKKGQLLSPEVRKEKQETLERKVRDLRRLADDFEKDLAKKDRELMVKFARDLSGVVQKVGKERGLLPDRGRARAGVIYGAPESDLTEEVIKEPSTTTPRSRPEALRWQPGPTRSGRWRQRWAPGSRAIPRGACAPSPRSRPPDPRRSRSCSDRVTHGSPRKAGPAPSSLPRGWPSFPGRCCE